MNMCVGTCCERGRLKVSFYMHLDIQNYCLSKSRRVNICETIIMNNDLLGGHRSASGVLSYMVELFVNGYIRFMDKYILYIYIYMYIYQNGIARQMHTSKADHDFQRRN